MQIKSVLLQVGIETTLQVFEVIQQTPLNILLVLDTVCLFVSASISL